MTGNGANRPDGIIAACSPGIPGGGGAVKQSSGAGSFRGYRSGAGRSVLASVTYKSKKDTWLIMVIYVAVCGALAACATLAFSGFPGNLVSAAFLFGIGVVLPLWLIRATFYVLDDQRLAIRCGPFRWSIPLAKIRSVKRTRSMLSGPALSLDRVHIRYGRFGMFGFVLKSPERRDRFLADLENRRSRLTQGARST